MNVFVRYIIFILFLCSNINAIAQQHDKKWVFGYRAGLDFNTSPPTPFIFNNAATSTIYSQGEADANVCDKDGNILFYTNGTQIYNRNQSLMPNGNDIVPIAPIGIYTATNSASQGTIIVPMPTDTNIYYVFSLACSEMLGDYGKLFYTVVDMRLNGGLGDVVAGNKGILLGNQYTEHMSAIAGGCGTEAVWLVLISRANNRFVTYKIDNTGLNTTPVISNSFQATINGSITGTIAPNPSNDKLIVSHFKSSNEGYLLLYNIDNNTGIVSNEMLLDSSSSYSSCFSPDGTKIYYTQWDKLYQIDLNQPTIAAIQNSKTLLLTGIYFTDLKIGLDQKIYFRGIGSNTTIGTINNPNLIGTSCNVIANSLQLATGSGIQLGLPNTVATYRYLLDTIFTTVNIEICKEKASLLLPNILDGENYLWNTNSSSHQLSTNTEGIYWVSYVFNCEVYIDTFNVSFYIYNDSITYITDSICPNEVYLFNNKILNQEGAYIDTLKNKYGCDSIVSLDLYHKNKAIANFDIKIDVDVCVNDTIKAQAFTAHTYAWQLNNEYIGSSPDISFIVPKVDNYLSLIITNTDGCKDTLGKQIAVNLCCNIFIPNAFSPNQDGLNDVFVPRSYGKIASYQLMIFDRYGTLIFETEDMNASWNGSKNGHPLESGVYFYFVKGKCLDDSDFVKKGDVTLIR
jgi:gliding motility-associated-like protein